MESRYDSKEIEERWYGEWEKNGLFKSSIDKNKNPYSIVIPPPNVTGILHMGHALNNTIQDILIRYKRMQGCASLWIPGTDHAGIATQNVVERQLAKEGLTRDDLGREKFIERVWKWRDEHGSTIVKQLRRLGASCDWSKERFTMDQGLSNAVLEAFIRLYDKGLIYRGNYIINWCPRCKTALSDEEVEYKEQESSLYYLKYPVSGGEDKFITVATTRPETMLGDVAIAVHPSDERFEFLKDKKIILPIINRKLSIVRDDTVDPEFGTGAVKITPAHDQNDFNIAVRHNLNPVVIMDESGVMNENAAGYEGMDRFLARDKIVEDLDKQDLIEKIEPYINSTGHCYRCDTVVEPYISWQWFVKMEPLTKDAIKVVKNKSINFFPSRWEKVYLHWMENIRDWCISRQIWWGHRIPVYYCRACYKQKDIAENLESNNKTKGLIVSRHKPKSCPDCGGSDIYQDQDVLDTWFSSWLWPFSTMGWPKDDTKREAAGKSALNDLDYFYPTSVLVTAQEILFFWVARMIMAGLEFVAEIPFSDVYIHGTVRDEKGRKMSKSLGNVIDPLEIIDEYGADALRFSLISITALGQDVFLSKDKFIFGRNFTNKIWNAARFIIMNTGCLESDFETFEYQGDSIFDNWVLIKLGKLIQELNSSLGSYNFNEAAFLLYEFFWHTFCDWYIEIKKRDLYSEDKSTQISATLILIFVLDNLLRLLHPFMPFITEEVWQMLRSKLKSAYSFLGLDYIDADSIMIANWPELSISFNDRELESRVPEMIAIIQTIRNIRAELNVPVQKKIEVLLSSSDLELLNLFKDNIAYLGPLAKVSDLRVEGEGIERPAYSAFGIAGGVNVYLLLENIIDLKIEKLRLSKKREDMVKDLEIVKNKLKNRDFVVKADSSVVERAREKEHTLTVKIAEITDIIDNI
jgi:valyl-tRNA synthetase